MTVGERTRIEQALDELRFHWDEAYKITCHPGEAEPCHAERLDDGRILTAPTSPDLHNKIIDDYRIRPVPRLGTVTDSCVSPAAASPIGTASTNGGRDAC